MKSVYTPTAMDIAPMTAAQLKSTLKSMALSQRKAAKELDINERTMRKYIASELPIPRTVQLSLYWFRHQQTR